MSAAAALETEVPCQHCGVPVHRGSFLRAPGWFAAVPFGEGMVLCRPAKAAGLRSVHEPLPEHAASVTS